jgi:L-alanine-DL-glutamate epimerase-like enolase superfamily enzyme
MSTIDATVRAPAAVERVEAAVHTVPTDQAEQDGTFDWTSTTVVVVRAYADGEVGLGYTYADAACAELISGVLAEELAGLDAMDVDAGWWRMVRRCRNLGVPGMCSMAIGAVDAALWDLKARLLELPLARLLGMARTDVMPYGSGGFTSYTDERMAMQLRGWADRGLRAVKIKVGRDPERDLERVAVARKTIGPEVDLYVDANGALRRKQALRFAEQCAAHGVSWFEEPVSSDDLDGLRLIRDRAPAGMMIAAGEYGFDLFAFRRMIDAGAVDVVQADATRCGGITGFLAVAKLCQAACLPLSAHTAPALHLHPCCAVDDLHSLEYFHDHTRIEQELFDGVVEPDADGMLRPNLDTPGNGLRLKEDHPA